MNRAERRRLEREGKKTERPAVYNFTLEELKAQIQREVRAEYEKKMQKIKQEATDDAINTAMCLLFVLPCEVLMDHFWKKSYARQIPKFTTHLLDYYDKWQNGELDMEEMQKDLWEYGGIKFQENDPNVKKEEPEE